MFYSAVLIALLAFAVAVENVYANCNAVKIISRSQWGAKAPKSRTNLPNPVGRVFIHHTAGTTCSSQSSCSSVLKGIQNYHQNSQGWVDIGYNFLIGGDGKVYEGRGWKTLGAHTANNNGNAIGISFMGNFQSVTPSTAMLNAAKNLIACGVSQKNIQSSYALRGHRDVYATACPGQRLYDIIKTWPRFAGKSG